jgi:hypothetical protein
VLSRSLPPTERLLIWCYIPRLLATLSRFSSLGLHGLNHAARSGDLCLHEVPNPLKGCTRPNPFVFHILSIAIFLVFLFNCNLVFNTHNYVPLRSILLQMSDNQASPSSSKRRRGNSPLDRPIRRRGLAPKKFKQDVYHLKRDDIPEDAGQFKVSSSFIFSP